MINMLVSLVLLTPVPFSLVDDLEISIEHLKRHKRAPHEGFLLTLGDMNLIRNRLTASERLCDQRVLMLKDSFQAELTTLMGVHELELVSYAGRIDELNADLEKQQLEIEDLNQQKSSIERSYTQYKVASYIVASLLVGSAIYSHFIF